MDQDVLKYGDLIILHGCLPSNLQNAPPEKRRKSFFFQNDAGFLSGLGFTDNRVFLQKIPSQRSNPLASVADLPNHKQLIFQVWPKLPCEAHKRMRKYKKERKLMSDLSDDDAHENADDIYAKLSIRVNEECKSHQRILGQVMGNHVPYGSEVQLMHYYSKSFLKADVTCSNLDKSAYRFELSHEFSARMAFRIRPKYSVRQEGEPIQFGDEILIYSSKLDCYVNFSLNQPIEIDKEVRIPPRVPLITKPFEHSKLIRGCKRYEAHISQFKHCTWRMYFYGSPQVDESSTVRGGDLVYLKHSQDDQEAYLTADCCLKSQTPEAYGRVYYGEVEEERDCINAIWEVETDNYNDRHAPCEVVDENKKPKHIRLRHLLTGKVLCYNTVDLDGQRWIIPALSKDFNPEIGAAIAFHPFMMNPKKELYYNTAYSMSFRIDPEHEDEIEGRSVQSKDQSEEYEDQDEKRKREYRFVSMQADKDYTGVVAEVSIGLSHSAQPTSVSAEDGTKVFKPLREYEFATKKKLIIAESLDSSAEHAFLLIKLDSQKEADIAFVASNIPILTHFRDLLKVCTDASQIHWDVIPRVIAALKSLIFFTHKVDPKLAYEYDALEFEGPTNVFRQKLLKDFRMIEILTEILYYPFYLGLFTLQRIHDKNFITIFQHCYVLLNHTINEYRPNELYASQWLELFMRQALASDSVDIKAEETLTELIDNNKRILDSKINSETIRQFVDSLKTNKNQKAVNLLQALIVCDGKAVLKNQTEASRLIFEHEEMKDTLIFKMRMRANHVQIDFKDYDEGSENPWMNLPDFYAASQQKDRGERYEYFLSLIYLFANLCLERNYIAIEGLQSIYTYEICFNIISGDYQDLWDLKAAFARLMNNLWIDRKPYHPLNLPRHIILWEDIPPVHLAELPAAAHGKVDMFENLMEYLQEYFSNLAQEGCTKIYETERNRFTLVVLEVAKTLATFGFYSTIPKLKGLAQSLLVMLNGMVDAMSRAEYEEFAHSLPKPLDNSPVKGNSSPDVTARSSARTRSASPRKGTRLPTIMMNKTESTMVLENSRRDPTMKFKETEETLIVMDCKNTVSELIKLIMTITNDINVMKFLSSFKNSVDFTSQSPSSPNRSLHRSLAPFIDPSHIRLSNASDNSFKNHVTELKKICEADSLDMDKLAPTSFRKILFNLLRYEHKDLISNAFEILCNSNAKQCQLKNTLDQIRLIESEDKRKGVKDIEGKIRRLEDLAETSETWYTAKQTFGFDSKFDKFIQLIKSLGEYLVIQHDAKAQDADQEEIIGFEEAMDKYEAEGVDFEIVTISGINYEYQQILKHLKVDQPLLELLKYEHSDHGVQRSEIQMKLLSEIVKFLTKFTYREKASQTLLSEHIIMFFKLLKRYPGIGFEGLIAELFRNNLKLLEQTKDVEKFVKNIIGLFTGKDMENYRNSRLLHSLQALMTYKGKAIKANQVIVMSALTVEQNAQMFFGFLTDSKKKELKAKLRDFDKKIENNTMPGGLVELPAELDLIISLIHVIARSADGKNAVTESKAQSLFSIDDLNFLYEASKHCWHLKYAVLSLFNHAYGDTEREIKEEISKTNNLIKAMVNDMEYLTKKPLKYRIVYHQGRIDSELIQEFVYFRGLVPCIEEILGKKLYKNIPDHVEIFTRVLDLLLRMNRKGLSKSNLRRRIRVSIDMFKIHARDIYNSLVTHGKVISEAPLSFSLQAIDAEAQDTLTPVVKDENTRTNHLKKIIKKITDREDFKLNVEEEFEKAVIALKNIEKAGPPNVYSSFLPFGETVKSLLHVIDIQEDIVDTDLKITGLRMFRRIIEAENKSQHTPAAEWDTDMWIKYERRIVGQQNVLAELGLVETLCKMISMSDDMDLQFECILVSIALLLGGNLNAQKAFLEYMQEDSDNAFLLSLKDLIIRNFDNIKKILSERNKYFMKKAHFVVEHEKIMYARKEVAKKIIENNLMDEKDSEQSIMDTELEEDYLEEVSKSFVLLQRVYRFLQLLCEGHNHDLQSHLLAQKNANGFANRKSFDFISHTAFYFNVLVKQINIDSLDLSVQILEFLIEAVQGPCEENQKALIKANIVNSCMDFMTTFRKRVDYMRRGFFTQEEMDDMEEASVKSMKLMNALIEGGISSDILSEMDSLDLRFLIDKISAFYSNFVKEQKMNPETESLNDLLFKLTNQAFDQKALESFDVYIFLANLADHSSKASDLLFKTNDYDLLTQKALEFFKASTAHIEILFRDKLIKTYFPLYPVCHHLTEDTKNHFMQNVNRSSPNDKILGLVDETDDLFDEMEHLTELNSKVFKFSMKRYNYLRDFSTILSFIMNLLFLGTAYYQIKEGVSIRQDHDLGKLPIFFVGQVLGWCQMITSALMILFWATINGPMVSKRRWREMVKKNSLSEEEEIRLIQLLEHKELGELPLKTVLNLLWRKGPYDPIFYKNGKRDFGHPFVRLVWLYKNMLFILSEGIFIFILFYFVVSVMGYTVSEIMYCLHLLDVINRFDTLRNVIRAVTYNGKQLMLTAFLGLILIYIYSLIGFVFLDDNYFDGDINERTCTTMIHCYLTTISFGLRYGGGIGEALQKPSFESDQITAYIFRFFFDVSFFIIINIVFLNIIFGIIIDTFAEMRDEKKAIDEDMQGKCYICNIERFTFDKEGGGWKNHIREDHYVWNFVYYIYSVQAKDPTEYNGIESYVKEKLEDEDTTWFPLQRALVFEPNDSKE